MVPDVIGLKLPAARRVLTRAGFRVFHTLEFSREPPGTVLFQDLQPGERAPRGTSIQVFVAEPPPTVPSLVGLGKEQATRRIEEAGLQIKVLREPSTSPVGTVIRQSPPSGTEVRLGRTVTIVLAKRSCHPSYRWRCLDPPAIDYDCVGGPGDGPMYTDTVQVVGPDVYGLDGDGDGTGCE